MIFEKLIAKRRSVYHLSPKLPIPPEQVAALTEDALKHCPTAFNSQSGRIALLFGNAHQKLWQRTAEALRRITKPEQFAKTEVKINSFAAGAGSVLFFIDDEITKSLQKNFPLYAANFPVWAEQAQGMLQYMVWTLLAEHKIGASLQHYNPLIDDAVHHDFEIPANWRLTAQMPFGGIAHKPDIKTFLPVENRFKVFGLKTAENTD